MKHLMAALILVGLVAVGCGGSDNANTLPTVNVDDLASGTCLAGDPNCADGLGGDAAGPLPDAIGVADPSDPDALLPVTFGGFFYSDGQTSQLCSLLAESFPPQCGDTVIEIDAPIETVLDYVAESWGNPDDAKINIDQGIYWTDNWINLTGVLQQNRLVLE